VSRWPSRLPRRSGSPSLRPVPTGHRAPSPCRDPAGRRRSASLPWVDRVLGDQPVAVVRLVHCEQGLIVAAGNPLGLGGIEDLTRPGGAAMSAASVGRGRACCSTMSSGSRGRRGGGRRLRAREAHASGGRRRGCRWRADCGLGVVAATRAFGLGFVPVPREPYNLVMAAETLDDPGSGRRCGSCWLRARSRSVWTRSAATRPSRAAAGCDHVPGRAALVSMPVVPRQRPAGRCGHHVRLVRAAFLAVARRARRRWRVGDARRREAPPGGCVASRAGARGGRVEHREPELEWPARHARVLVDRHVSSSRPGCRGMPTSAPPWSAGC
jgi:PBP superfamily domain